MSSKAVYLQLNFKTFGACAVLMAVFFLFGACAPEEKKTTSKLGAYYLACGPKNQRGAFMNPIDARKIVPLSVDSRFDDFERGKIEAAVQTWNETSQEIFKVEYRKLSTSSKPSSTSDCKFEGSSEKLSILKETNMDHWRSLGLSEANPGVTVRCTRDQGFVFRQVVMINFDVGVEKDQYESIVLHELGHAIGLRHSCSESLGAIDYISCMKVEDTKGHPYHDAVMYPLIQVGIYKNKLTKNDLDRAECILGESK